MNRKQRRQMEREVGKENAEDLTQKIFQFNKLPDACSACLAPFDKKSKEMAQTWNVVVQDEDTVRVYCPDCWSKAQAIIEDFVKERND